MASFKFLMSLVMMTLTVIAMPLQPSLVGAGTSAVAILPASGSQERWAPSRFTQAGVNTRPINAAFGATKIYNHCDYSVHLVSVDHYGQDTPTPHTITPHAFYLENHHDPHLGGISVKLSRAPDMLGSHGITQYEYNMTPEQGMSFYDLSNVNCSGSRCPFMERGMSMRPADPSVNCPKVSCAAGAWACNPLDVYCKHDDDKATKSCSIGANMEVHLCSASFGH